MILVTGQWTWVSGSNVPNQVGIYAGKGTPCATSMPGARYASISWTDTSGNLWLFGGRGYWDEPGDIILNDLWRYELPECIMDNDCQEGESCVEGTCEQQIPDNPPALGDGPFVAAGTWPLLPTSAESPMYLDQNEYVLWTFSDDYGSCSEMCTHTAEYQAIGDESWTKLSVTTDPTGKKYAYVDLPIDELQNATTYAFRYTVTDCAAQTTQSATYYFRVAITDAPPLITSGPFLAAGAWPVLPTSPSRAFVLDQNYNVLWTFSDDYASCAGLCTHRARYRKVGDTAWTWIDGER